MAKRDYYDVLGVPRRATGSEIRRAYRRLARQYSPDVNPWDQSAEGLFEEIAEAYRVLADPAGRALYDRYGHGAFGGAAAEGSAQALRGDDLHAPVEIDLEEALHGVSTVVEITRHERCRACGGTGGADGAAVGPCAACGGRPIQIVRRHQGTAVTARCTACGGTGRRWPPPCGSCAGRGTTPRPARLVVQIPPGVDTGSQVRVPGEGHAAPIPGRPGDLVVITRVRAHPLFTRKGDNLYCEVPITVPEAALGARIRVPTPDGPAVLTVPSGTQSGQTFRVRAKGCPRLDRDGRGDLYVVTQVVIPRNPDSTLEAVLRALERLLPEDPRAPLWAHREVRP
jgi:molecular chaperone DnaJ